MQQLKLILGELWNATDTLQWDYIQKAWNYERFGNDKDEQYYNYVNDFNYLFTTLALIYTEETAYKLMTKKKTGCEASHTLAYYETKYNLLCLYHYFKCRQINLQTFIENLIKGYIISTDGIGGMYIETAPSNNCQSYNLFKIS